MEKTAVSNSSNDGFSQTYSLNRSVKSIKYAAKTKIFDDVYSLSDSISICVKCPLLVKCRTRPVPGYGDPKSDVLFVGEAPGRLGADITGIPFTRDRSGVLLQKMLVYVGLSGSSPTDPFPKLYKAFVTNIVKCNPQHDDGTNRPPSKEEINNCSRFLKEEIRLLRPKIIVPLGVKAAKQIMGKEFDGSEFGRVFQIDNILIYPIWHPGFVVRGGGRKRITEKKYKKAFLRLKSLIRQVDPNFESVNRQNLDYYEERDVHWREK